MHTKHIPFLSGEKELVAAKHLICCVVGKKKIVCFEGNYKISQYIG